MCALQLNPEELHIARRVESYFGCTEMDFRDKVFHARLIAQYDLDARHYSNEMQRIKITRFLSTLNAIWDKMNASDSS